MTGVVKNYRTVRALRDVSFDLAPGRLSALVGHNGAGKTTLIKLMLGLIRPDRGSIRVLDEDPAAGEFSARRLLGYLPENVAFNAALTGDDAGQRAFHAGGHDDDAARAKAIDLHQQAVKTGDAHIHDPLDLPPEALE